MYKNTDETFLVTLNDILKQNPDATQRDIARVQGISLGMVNAVLNRIAGKGWVKLQHVNARSIRYALTPEGLAEIARRTADYMRRSFAEMRSYGNNIASRVQQAKENGCARVVLYGESNLDFLIAYECQMLNVPFEKRESNELAADMGEGVLAIAGERETADNVRADAVSVMEMVG